MSRPMIQWGKRQGVGVCPICQRTLRPNVWAVKHSNGRGMHVYRHAYPADCKPIIDSRPAGSR